MAGAVPGAKTSVLPLLDSRQRERERERCGSAAAASCYRPIRVRNDPHHICPQRTHAKTTPLHAIRPSPLTSPDKRLTSTQKINPNLNLFPCPQPGSTSTDKPKQKPTEIATEKQDRRKNGSSKPSFRDGQHHPRHAGTRMLGSRTARQRPRRGDPADTAGPIEWSSLLPPTPVAAPRRRMTARSRTGRRRRGR